MTPTQEPQVRRVDTTPTWQAAAEAVIVRQLEDHWRVLWTDRTGLEAAVAFVRHMAQLADQYRLDNDGEYDWERQDREASS